jgi:hypothetical protein
VCKRRVSGWAPVAHTCNPSYSGGRDQEDCGLKPTWANSSRDPISKKTLHKKLDWWSDSRCRPWVQAPPKKEKKKSFWKLVNELEDKKGKSHFWDTINS